MLCKILVNIFALYMSIAFLYIGLHNVVAGFFGEEHAFWSLPIFIVIMLLMSWGIWQSNIDLFLQRLYK